MLECLPHRLDQLGLGVAEEVTGDPVQLLIALGRNGPQAGLQVRKVVDVALATRIEGAQQDLQRFAMRQHLLPGAVDRRIEGVALKDATQHERCAMIEHREGRGLARNGLEERPHVVVSPGDSW
jgi:hypothetical protein